MRTRRAVALATTSLALAVLGSTTACATLFPDHVEVTPEPKTADVYVNGKKMGTGITDFTVPNDGANYEVRVCSEPRFECSRQSVTATADSWLTVKLKPNMAYQATVDIQIANKSVEVQAGRGYSHQDAWPKVVACITDDYSDLATLDSASGYLKTAWKVKDYGYPSQDKIRTRIVANLEDQSPLTYRLRLQTQKFAGGDSWAPYDRAFPADRDAISCVRNRLRFDAGTAPAAAKNAGH